MPLASARSTSPEERSFTSVPARPRSPAPCTSVGARLSGKQLRPHNVPMVMLGAGILWFGWFGFNAGSALGAGGLASSAFLATQLGAVGAMLAWLALEKFRHGKATAIGATGAVAGLVAITPAAGYVAPMPALLIGLIAGLVCFTAVELKPRLGYDDSLDAVAYIWSGARRRPPHRRLREPRYQFRRRGGRDRPGRHPGGRRVHLGRVRVPRDAADPQGRRHAGRDQGRADAEEVGTDLAEHVSGLRVPGAWTCDCRADGDARTNSPRCGSDLCSKPPRGCSRPFERSMSSRTTT